MSSVSTLANNLLRVSCTSRNSGLASYSFNSTLSGFDSVSRLACRRQVASAIVGSLTQLSVKKSYTNRIFYCSSSSISTGTMAPTSVQGKHVTRVADSVEKLEGEGFRVRQGYPTRKIGDINTDPFLLLHEFGPVDYTPGEAKGAPDHPHRGFETVSYIIEGSNEHMDSTGLSGKLGTGDFQWMTAGKGVVHSEMPSREIQEKGGRVHGFQIWVNLPKKDKMVDPRYQDVPAATIPVATSDDGKVWVKVVAGESLDKKAVIDTHTPITFLHIKLQPGAEFDQSLPSDQNVHAYVFGGKGVIGSSKTAVESFQVALLSKEGGSVYLANPAETADGVLDVLLLGGVPLKEPIARYGPFVMNTPEEIQQAFEDYRNGRMGAIRH